MLADIPSFLMHASLLNLVSQSQLSVALLRQSWFWLWIPCGRSSWRIVDMAPLQVDMVLPEWTPKLWFAHCGNLLIRSNGSKWLISAYLSVFLCLCPMWHVAMEDMPDMASLSSMGEKFRLIREAEGMTRQEFADCVGLPYGTVTNYEVRGK